VTDANGDIVRHIEGPVTTGFHRVAWDLRYPNVSPWVPEEKREVSRYGPVGVLAEPGNYTVTMSRRVDGKLQDLNQSQTFNVNSIREPTLPGTSQDVRVAFSRRSDELRRAVSGSVSAIDELLIALNAIKEATLNSTASASLYEEADSMTQRAQKLRTRLAGSLAQDIVGYAGPVSISKRITAANSGSRSTVYGPTAMHKRSLEIADEEFVGVGQQIDRLIESEFRELRQKLDAAGVPWTPGRGVPVAN
jgi:hypothetical protein